MSFRSQLDRRSAAFTANREHMQGLVAALRQLEHAVRAHSERARTKMEKRGQLVPRERVARLLDPGAPFLELSTLAGYKLHDDDGKKDISGGGNITGIGFVSGVRCLVTCSDAGIKGGSVTPMGLHKSLRAQQLALRCKLPSINLVESGGANLLHQSEIFVEGGRIFYNMARLSAAGLPQVSVVHGSSTAGGAYLPGLSDTVIAVRDNARIYLAGPPLVKAALGEDATEAELGGAEMHATVSGTVEYLANDDGHALDLARQVIDHLDWNRTLGPESRRPSLPPKHDPGELHGLVPVDGRTPYDARELLVRLLDDSAFLAFKEGFGSDTVCARGRLDGWSVGVVANNGPISPQGSVKAAQFIQLCCQTGTPLVFLMNTTGYMVGTQAEQAGAIKHGAKMIQAVANASVPKLTVIVGGGYGAGNYGMAGRAYEPDFLFAWPNARVAVMGGQQAATVMKIITRNKLERKGLPVDDAALDALSGEIERKLDAQTTALFATARLWDDGIIDPRDTRDVLAFCLATVDEARRRTLNPNSFGVARG